MERSQEYEPIILDLQKSQVIQRPKHYLLVSVVIVIVLGVVAGTFAGIQYWRSTNEQQGTVKEHTLIDEPTPTASPVSAVIPVNISPTPIPTLTPTLVEAEATGILNLYSIPDRADVVINGERLGSTPLINYKLRPGTYTIKFSHQGKISEQKIAIQAGETTEYTHRFEGFGLLSVKTIPSGSDIYINGQFAGKDPLQQGGLSPGTYTVSARKVGYATTEETVILQEGDQPQEVLLILKRLDLETGSSSGRDLSSTPRPVHPSER